VETVRQKRDGVGDCLVCNIHPYCSACSMCYQPAAEWRLYSMMANSFLAAAVQGRFHFGFARSGL
jgi:hypothetical protein